MFYRVFNSRTKTITFAAGLLAISGILSRFLALIRDRLLAGKFGAGAELDIYFAAFRIPDFVYGILIIGGISTVFLPVFSEYFKKDPNQGWDLTNNVLNCFLILLILVCAILAVFTPFFIKFIVPGFSQENRVLAISLTRIMFLSPILLGLSSVFSGILHYFNRFLVYSLAPVLYNIGIILGILFLYPIFGIQGLAFGVILGAFLHWVIQIPAAKILGYKYQPSFNFRCTGLSKIFKLMIPRTIGSAAYHINLIIITAIASTLAAGSIAIFNFAYNLNYVPIGIIAIPFVLAVFPVLSRNFAQNQKEKFLENFSSTFRQILFLIIPVSVSMFLLRAQIVRLILGTGRFGWEDTRLTAACLGLFCFGIFAAALVPFLSRTFYSFQETRTPVVIGVLSIFLNIILCFLLVWLLGFPNIFQQFMINNLKLQGIENIQVVGLPLALAIFGVFQSSLLLIFLKKRIGDIRLEETWQSFKKIFFSTVLLGVSTYLILKIVAPLVNMQTFFGVLIQTVLAGMAGILVYILVSSLLKSPELKIIKSSILKQFTPTP